MKSALKVCATVAALAVLGLAVSGAVTPAAAAYFVIGTSPGTTEADCTKGGGTVTVDAQGRKICTLCPVKTATPDAGREPPN